MLGLWPDLLLALSVVFGSLLVFAGSLYALKRSKRIYMIDGYVTSSSIKYYQVLLGEVSSEMVPPIKWKPIIRGVDVKVTIPKLDVKFHIPDIEPSPDAKRIADLIDKAVQDQIKKGGGYVRP